MHRKAVTPATARARTSASVSVKKEEAEEEKEVEAAPPPPNVAALVVPLHHQGRVRALASANSLSEEATPWLVSAGEDRDVCICNASTGELVRRISGFTGRPGHPGHTDKIYAVQVWLNKAAGFHHIYSAGEDRAIRVWNLETGKHIQTLAELHTDFVHSMRLYDPPTSSSVPQLASASYDRQIILWSVDTGEVKDAIMHDKVMYGFDINAEARSLASCCGTCIYLWDISSTPSKKTHVLRLHKRTVVSVVYPTPTLLLSGSDDKTLCVWDPTTGLLVRRIEIGVPAYSLRAYNDGTAQFAIAGSFAEPYHVFVYNLEDLELAMTFTGHTNKITSVCLWKDEGRRQKLASAGWDHAIRTFDLGVVVQDVHAKKLKKKQATSKML